MSIIGQATGGFGQPKLLEIVDDNGNSFVGVVTDSEVDVNATKKDVRIGKVFASNEGFAEGENTITYRTTKGRKLILSGESLSIPLSQYDQYDFTELQCAIAPFNTSGANSVAIDRVAFSDYVYPTGSAVKISDVTKNDETKSIDLNILNNTDNYCVIHYFTYRNEE